MFQPCIGAVNVGADTSIAQAMRGLPPAFRFGGDNMFCNTCGNKCYDNAKFCHKCGARCQSIAPQTQTSPFIGNWKTAHTTQPDLANMIANGKAIITQYYDDNSGITHIVDKAIAEGGQGNIYHEQIFMWKIAPCNSILQVSIEEDGTTQSENVRFELSQSTITFYGDGYTSTEHRLADDFEIVYLEEGKQKGGSVAGKVVGGFVRGVIEGLLE